MTVFPSRFRPSLHAAVVVALANIASAQTPLPKDSPFLPANAPVAAQAAGEIHELAGVSTMEKKTSVNIFNKQTAKGHWIVVGETVEGISVLNYDSPREQALVRVGGVEKLLKLRKATSTGRGTVAGGNATTLPAGPNGGFRVTGSPPAPVPGVNPTLVPSPVVPTPAPKQEPPPPIGSVAHQEQEARMLVSDLLEIGMAQRKAYEEAQKKAAGTNPPDSAATPRAGANPAPPAPPPGK